MKDLVSAEAEDGISAHTDDVTTSITRQPRSDHIGLLCAVIAPSVFWAAVVFVICLSTGWQSAAVVATLFFVGSTAFLGVISSMLRVRL